MFALAFFISTITSVFCNTGYQRRVYDVSFYRAMRMHSTDDAVARCPSVCQYVRPSVCLSHAGIESKRLHISSKFFHSRVALHSSFFPHQTGWRYSDGDPLTGAPNTRGCEKSRFSTNISLYLENDA